MAEFSLFHTTGTSGDGASPYTQAQVTDWIRRTFCKTPASQCVHRGWGSDLAVSGVNGASPSVNIAAGAGIVYGFPYENTTTLNIPFTKPAVGTTGYRVVLQMNWTTHQVRTKLLSSADGASAIPAVTQSAGTLWEVSLATFTCTTGGVITLTDTRGYLSATVDAATADGSTLEIVSGILRVKDLGVTQAKLALLSVGTGQLIDANVTQAKMAANSVGTSQLIDANVTQAKLALLAVGTAQLAADSVDDTKAGNRVPQFYRRQGGSATDWNSPGTTTQTPGAVRVQGGVFRQNFASANTVNTLITFPVAFGQPPIVIAFPLTPGTGTTHFHTSGNGITASTAALTTRTTDGNPITNSQVDIAWIAIGPE